MSHYVAAKSAVNGLTKSLALDYGPAGITVNAVPPGFIDTPMLRNPEARGRLRDVQATIDATPVRCIGRPEDIVSACAFLISEEAGYITGPILGRQRRPQHLAEQALCNDVRMSTEPAHFTLTEGGAFQPSPFAQSHWGDNHLNGPAVVGLAARALERYCGSPDFMPARFTADLFRAARNVPTTVDVRVLRDGRRVRSAECDVIQKGRTVTRATLVQYRRSSAPPGRQWTAPISLVQPPPPDDSILPHVGSDDAGWTRSPAAHQNDTRKRFYNDGIKVVAGEKNSPFVRAVMIAESTSLVTNLGTHGIGYINGDLTAAFSRLPVDDWICVQADSHSASDGISVGTATLFDHQGAFGSGLVTAVANPEAQIDFSGDVTPMKGLNYE